MNNAIECQGGVGCGIATASPLAEGAGGAPHALATPRPERALRAIAAFEAFKGLLAMAATLGLLSLLHHDLHHLAVVLIGHVGLSPGDHYPALILRDVDQLLGADRRPLMFAASAYIIVRFAEAYGLWAARPWGFWLGALSGVLYLPFEVLHLVHRLTLLGAGVVAANLALVGFLVWQLRRRAGSNAS